MNFSVTQNGQELSKEKYDWDESTKTFSTNESNLVLDFSEIDRVTFKTYDNCTFNTGSFCTFKTGSDCTFKTGSYCTFNTGSYCTFNTAWKCTFEVGEKCSLHYHWNECFEVYKLEPNKLVKILKNGQLENLKEIEISKVEYLDELVLLHSEDLKFMYSNEENKYQELLEAFKSKNDTKLFMLNDNSSFANNLIKIFKFSS